LKRRFPSYFAESNAFVEADPLSAARSKIEARVPLDRVRRLLIGPRLRILALRECASRLRNAGVDVLMVVVTPRRSGWYARFEAGDESIPQALKIDAQPDAQASSDLERQLRKWRFDRVEVLDLFSLPESLTSSVERLGIPIDLVAADATLGAEARLRAWSNPEDCDNPGDALIEPCARCRAEAGPEYTAEAKKRLMRLEKHFETMVFLDEMTQQSWTGFFKLGSRARPTPVFRRPVANRPESRLTEVPRQDGTEVVNVGILFPQETTSALRLVFLFSEHVRRWNANAFLFGATSLDERLIGCGVFVCGKIAPSERETILRQYGIGAIVLPYRSGFLWHLDAFVASTRAPAAYFGPLPASKALREVDLSIDPRVCDLRAAALFSEWLPRTESKRLTAYSDGVGERGA